METARIFQQRVGNSAWQLDPVHEDRKVFLGAHIDRDVEAETWEIREDGEGRLATARGTSLAPGRPAELRT